VLVKRVALFALPLALLCACSAGARSDVRAQGGPPRVVSAPEIPDRAPQVRDQVGLASELGVLALWCEGSHCTRHANARPRKYLPADPSGLIVFATGIAPSAARVETDGVAEAVVPGTTMAVTLDLARGAHVVTLVESWPGREARWVFGVRAGSA
jgi:hypothetical protein